MRGERRGRLGAALFGLLLAAAVLVAPAAPARASENGCAGAVNDLKGQLGAVLAPVKKNPALARGSGANQLQTKVAAVFAGAQRQHPECKSEIAQAAQTLRAQAAGQNSTGAHAKGFLGPIGWLWNNIYYRVFQGNNVMMAVFGWELFLSPVILVLSAMAVVRGATGAIRKPVVPDAIRTAS